MRLKYKEFSKKSMRNLLRAHIDVHSRRLIADFPKYGIKCIENLQSHFSNIFFSEKVGMKGFFNKSHIKDGDLQ